MAPTGGGRARLADGARATGPPRQADGGVVPGAAGALRSLSPAAPLHPILVHFTIALTASSLLFDLLGRALHDPGLAAAGWWTLALGTLATVLTLVTGVVSRLHLEIGEGEARSFLRLHMVLGPVFFGMLLATASWRAVSWQAGEEPGGWYLATLAATAAVMAVQGYLGGELVYRWGAEVNGGHRGLRQRLAREPRPRWPPSPAAASQSQGAEEG